MERDHSSGTFTERRSVSERAAKGLLEARELGRAEGSARAGGHWLHGGAPRRGLGPDDSHLSQRREQRFRESPLLLQAGEQSDTEWRGLPPGSALPALHRGLCRGPMATRRAVLRERGPDVSGPQNFSLFFSSLTSYNFL